MTVERSSVVVADTDRVVRTEENHQVSEVQIETKSDIALAYSNGTKASAGNGQEKRATDTREKRRKGSVAIKFEASITSSLFTLGRGQHTPHLASRAYVLAAKESQGLA